jgi:indolepyruvate ferredoxin oxidoreductase beta subunit
VIELNETNNTINIIIAGVGGQGTLLASKILGNVALRLGYKVKVSEVHGMSQRGGSVITYVKIGKEVYSPVIDKGEADYIIAFEKLEALRWLDHLKSGGTVIVNNQRIDPMPVIAGTAEYPERIAEDLKKVKGQVITVDAMEIAVKSGTIKAVNVVMIGTLARLTGISKDVWINAIKDEVPEKFIEVNLKAFEGGYMGEVLE